MQNKNIWAIGASASLVSVILTGCGTLFGTTASFPDPSPVLQPVESVPDKPAEMERSIYTVKKANVSDEQRAAALAYMELIGIDLSMGDLIDNVMRVYQTNFPTVPAKFWKEFKSQVDVTSVNEVFIEEIANAYTLEELHQVNIWLASPLGTKYLEQSDSLSRNNSNHSVMFGREISFNLVRALRRAKYMY